MRFSRRIRERDVGAAAAAVRESERIGFERVWLSEADGADPRMVVGLVNQGGLRFVLQLDPTADMSVPAGLDIELAVAASAGWRDSLSALIASAPYSPDPAAWAVAGDVASVAAAGHAGVGVAFEALEQAEAAEEWVSEYEAELSGGSVDPLGGTSLGATAVFLEAGEDPDALIGLIERYREAGVDEVILHGPSSGDRNFMTVVMSEFDDDEVREQAGERKARRESALAAIEAKRESAARAGAGDAATTRAKKGRRSPAMAKRVAGLQKSAVARMSDRQLELLIGNRIGVRALFHATARMYQPSKAGDFSGPIEFTLETPHGPEVWTIDCQPTGAKAHRGESPDAQLRLDAGIANFLRIGVGEISAPSAVLAGRLNVRGDFGLALKLAEMFGGPSIG